MRRTIFVVAALAVLVLAIGVQPAHAVAQITGGSIEASCTVMVDDFPNSVLFPPGADNVDDCDPDKGGAPASLNPAHPAAAQAPINEAVGAIVGTIGTTPLRFVANGLNSLRSTVNYSEPCPSGYPEGVFPVIGQSRGMFLVTGTLTQGTGAPDSSVDLVSGYDWQRYGATAVITYSNGSSMVDSARTTDAASGSKLIAVGTGFDTDQDGDVDVPAPNYAAASIGLLQPRWGAGNDKIDNDGDTQIDEADEGNTCLDKTGNQYEVVTAHTAGLTASYATA
jgi:hypothetical protein